MTGCDELQDRIGYHFRDPNLLRIALTHPSIAHETGAAVEHNQRLEFLGDSVLGLILSEELYKRYRDVDEGPLTKARAQMVNRGALADQGRRLDLGRHLLLGRGEEMNGGRERSSALADAYEAVLGAIFLDGGFDAARAFILASFEEALGLELEIPNLDNPKGELQELLQAESLQAPQYHIVSTTGPDHDRQFECVVTHQGNELGRGSGRSKKSAECEAAKNALNKLRESPESNVEKPGGPQ